GIDGDRRMVALKRLARSPVRRGPPTVEQARARQQEGPGAYRTDPACPACGQAQPLGQPLVASCFPDAEAPGYEERVDRPAAAVDPALRDELQAAGCPDWRGLGSHELELV